MEDKPTEIDRVSSTRNKILRDGNEGNILFTTLAKTMKYTGIISTTKYKVSVEGKAVRTARKVMKGSLCFWGSLCTPTHPLIS